MRIRTKSTLLIVAALVVSTIVLTAIATLAFRSFSLDAARHRTATVAGLIQTALTEEMIMGAWDRHEQLLRHFQSLPGLTHVDLVPTEAILRDFPHLAPDVRRLDPLMRQSIQQKHVVEQLNEDLAHADLRLAVPFIAETTGQTDCLSCHHVDAGTVLGVVHVQADLTNERWAALKTIAMLALTLLMFGGVLAFGIRQVLRPIMLTTGEMQEAVTKAATGDFSGRIKRRSNDEMGEIAEASNGLFERLEQTFGEIIEAVGSLHRRAMFRTSASNRLEETRRMIRDMVQSAHFKKTIEDDRNIDEVYARVRSLMADRLGWPTFTLYEVNSSKNRMKAAIIEGPPAEGEIWCNPELLISCEACRAFRTGQIVNDVQHPGICPAFWGNHLQRERELSHVCIPLLESGSVGAVFQLVDERAALQRRLGDMDGVQGFLDVASPVIGAKRLMQALHETAMRDAMTGMYNRRFLDQYLETLLPSLARRDQKMGVLMIDVDFFKQVNDTMGHETGDKVLKEVASLVQQCIRASDLAVRYGGEEFMALLPDATEEGALAVAERIRASMESREFSGPGAIFHKTLSIGVSIYPDDAENFWQAVKYADVALYNAKEHGRNRVVRFTSDMWTEDKY